MSILPILARDFQFLFPRTIRGQERFHWFLLTLKAILVPITASRTSNLLRAIETLFGVSIAQWRYYTFMASVKLPWARVWEALWRAIPSPLVAGRLLLGSRRSGRRTHLYSPKRTLYLRNRSLDGTECFRSCRLEGELIRRRERRQLRT